MGQGAVDPDISGNCFPSQISSLASSRQTGGIPDSIILIQKHEKDYFIKGGGFGNIQKRCIDTTRNKRTQPFHKRGLKRDSHW